MTSPHDDAPRPPTWAAPAGTGAPPPEGVPPTGPAAPTPPQPPTGWGQQQPPGAPGAWGPAAPPPPGVAWRPPALQPGIIPLRPLGMGEIYDGAFRAVRANPRVMFGLAALVVTLAVTLQSVVQWYIKGIIAPQLTDLSTEVDPSGQMGFAEQMGSSFGLLVAAPVTTIATTILTGLLILSVSRSVLGQVATVGEVLRSRRVWLVVGFTFLTGLATLLVVGALAAAVVLLAVNDQIGAAVAVGLVGSLALVVAAVWFATRTLLVPPALMLEGKKFWPTITRAWKLTRGSFWRLFGIYLLTSILAGIIAQIIVVPASVFGQLVLRDPTATSFASIVVTGIATVIASTLSTTFVSAVVALLYIDVRMRREGLDVELARAAESTA
ncbi:glycerophosphoryl diester phosphodiesterase membrane domain-containing protein [Cellulomonas fengjieae]|uniref:Glycerophosphoryl diester phosphodiesterase membrane domain-containing protein n=1 Tax=Cellulomonas fengjieae TaxID=2819978 RepID=A0ABS3SDQ1_9CELL|nr:glycerophosphoryl diester phosphodiesterase membrane domain-containing protein [Cellulomonas fengjieae]MBO3083883.1 glycerophosphoryl diester phosphodiesterase membrane domain-containing protein [Cellulomonas fengjieae]QVI64834.1 glycerophosphoryl diester phosphodiesterase membrane domain-containing protein [Cellulomonas fengjieae]